MIIQLKRRGIELCEINLISWNNETKEEEVSSFKGSPEQVKTWAKYQGADPNWIDEAYETMFEDNATNVEVNTEEKTIECDDEGPQIIKKENNVVFVNFKKVS